MQRVRGSEIIDPETARLLWRRLTDDLFHWRVGSRKSRSPVTKVLVPPCLPEVRVVIPRFSNMHGTTESLLPKVSEQFRKL